MINSITIDNYKNLSLTLPINGNTLIEGPVGSGKSSIGDCLYTLISVARDLYEDDYMYYQYPSHTFTDLSKDIFIGICTDIGNSFITINNQQDIKHSINNIEWLSRAMVIEPYPPLIGTGYISPNPYLDIRASNLGEYVLWLIEEFPGSKEDILSRLEDIGRIRDFHIDYQINIVFLDLVLPFSALSSKEKMVFLRVVIDVASRYYPLLCYWDDIQTYIDMVNPSQLIGTNRPRNHLNNLFLDFPSSQSIG